MGAQIIIRVFKLAEDGIRPQFEALIHKHWCAVQQRFGEEEFSLNWQLLENIERMGMGCFLGAFKDSRLIGYYASMFVPSLHTKGLKIAQDLGWFVDPMERAGGAGIRLLDLMEEIAAFNGCRENAISIKILKNDAPERLLARRGYLKSEHRHTKQLKNIGGEYA